MIFHVLMNQITSLFISVNLLTSLSFDSQITSYMYGGSKDDLFIKLAGGMKTLALKPIRKEINSNLLVITETGKYYFLVQSGKTKPHQFIEVRRGEINSAYRVIKKYSGIEIWEGSNSMMVINHTKKEVKVNEAYVSKKGYFSKGVPLIINGKRVMY